VKRVENRRFSAGKQSQKNRNWMLLQNEKGSADEMNVDIYRDVKAVQGDIHLILCEPYSSPVIKTKKYLV
jgi:hypothetical protein